VRTWAQIEEEAAQRLLGAMVGSYGAALSEETEEQARVLATVALAHLRGPIEKQRQLADLLDTTAERWDRDITTLLMHLHVNDRSIADGWRKITAQLRRAAERIREGDYAP